MHQAHSDYSIQIGTRCHQLNARLIQNWMIEWFLDRIDYERKTTISNKRKNVSVARNSYFPTIESRLIHTSLTKEEESIVEKINFMRLKRVSDCRNIYLNLYNKGK